MPPHSTRKIIVAAAILAALTGAWLGTGPARSWAERRFHAAKVTAMPAVIAPLPAQSQGKPVSDQAKTGQDQSAPPAQHPPVSSAASIIASRWANDLQPEFIAFRQWAAKHAQGAPANFSPAILGEGQRLATARRAVLAKLIETDPKRALANAVPWSVRVRLPSAILALLEERVDGAGELVRREARPKPGVPLVASDWVSARVDGKSYHAFTTGPNRQRSLGWAAIHGIALDSSLAITDSPVRTVEAEEPMPLNRPSAALCPVSGKNTPITDQSAKTQNLLDTGDGFVSLCSPAHAGVVEQSTRQKETNRSPWIQTIGQKRLASGGSGNEFLDSNIQPSQEWTTGSKKLLIIRIAFTDEPTCQSRSTLGSVPLSEPIAAGLINNTNGVRDFISQNSYGRTTIALAPVNSSDDSPDITPVLTMAKPASYYVVGADYALAHPVGSPDYNPIDAAVIANDTLIADAEAKAASGPYNFDLSKYDRIGIFFSDLSQISSSVITYGGLGDLEGRHFLVNGEHTTSIVAHELGHTYGLPHAGRVTTATNDPLANGEWDYYGDIFDIMGNGLVMPGHFSMWAKTFLHWIDESATQLVTATSTTGTVYKVWRFDHPSANPSDPSMPLALRIARQAGVEYWIGFRGAYTTNDYTNKGAHIIWAQKDGTITRVIDCNDPTLPTGKGTTPLTPGSKTLNDALYGITIQTLGREDKKGGSPADSCLNIKITINTTVEPQSLTLAADEQAGPFKLLLQRQQSISGEVTCPWSTITEPTPGFQAAAAGADFTAVNGSANWLSGDSSPSVISLPIIHDQVADNKDIFKVKLGKISGASLPMGSNIAISIQEPGSPDPGFRSNNNPSITSNILAVLPEYKGKVIIGGWFTNFGNHHSNYVARLNDDGSEDSTFAATELTNAGGPANALALQSDGKILVGGNFSTQSHGQAHLLRLNPDGSIDNTFLIGTGPNTTVHCLYVQPDGKIVVGGSFSSFNGTSRRGIVRLTGDGSIDSTFVNPAFDSSNAFPTIYCITPAPGGQLIIGGAFSTSLFPPYGGGVAKLNPDGRLDPGFSPQNGTSIDAFNHFGDVRAIGLLVSGQIVVGGTFSSFNGASRDHLAVLGSNGSLDASITPGVNGTVYSILPLPDGTFVAGGDFGGPLDGSAAHLNCIGHVLTDGSWDLTFDNCNEVDSTVFALELEPQSRRILAGGVSSTFEYFSVPANGKATFDTPVFRLLSGQTPAQPSITAQPSNIAVDEKQPFTLSVKTEARQYWCQWYQNDLPVAGATSLSYTAIGTRSDDGTWQARITTPQGVVASNTALVTVKFEPVVTKVTVLPANGQVDIGGTAQFTVTAKGGGLSYQWQRNGISIPGATAATLSLSSITAADDAYYQCVVSNELGSAVSDPAILTVVTPPVIITHPEDTSILVGQSVTLSVTAKGINLAYQWRKDGVSIPKATASTYRIASVTTAHAGTYSCKVSNSSGYVYTNSGRIHVVVKPVISPLYPVAQTRPAGGTVSFQVIASGEFLTYQWQRNSVDIPGATASTLQLAALAAKDAGSYSCIVRNAAGSAVSKAAGLTVYPAPIVNTQPEPLLTVPRGRQTTLNVAATAYQPTFQWQHNGANIPGANATTLVIPYPDTADEGSYVCIVTNGAGSTGSNPCSLAVVQPPAIILHPAQLAVELGAPASFTISATGSSLAYQWQKDGSPVAGATNATLNLATVTAADIGAYRCVVTNQAGSATSINGQLSINGRPVITQHPPNVAAETGASASLSVAATGTGLAYQWHKNGVVLKDKISPTLSLTPFTKAFAGTYTCSVTDTTGAVIISRAAQVTLSTTLGAAMEDNVRKWQSLSPTTPWIAQKTTAHDATDALKAAPVLDGERCILKTIVTGPVLVRFWRKVSSQENSDFLRYTVDGITDPDVPDVSGEVPWQECLSLIPAGSHELAWSYEKDTAGFYGSDTAWLDSFSIGVPAYIVQQPANVLATTTMDAHFEVGVRTLGTTYQWRKNGGNIAGATQPTLDLTNVTTASAGDYSVVVGGKVLSAAAKLCVVGAPIPSRVAANTTATLTLPLGGASFTDFQWYKPDRSELTDTGNVKGSKTSKLTISGLTPANVGDYECVVSAFTPTQTILISPCTVGIVTQPVVNAEAPPPAIVAGAFYWQLTASEFPTSYIVTGLPSGLKYDPVTGLVTGIPSVSGTFGNILVIARNTPFKSVAKPYTLTIAKFPAGATGTFSALVARDAARNNNLGGLLSLNVLGTGAYTGRLTQGTKVYNLSGRAVANVDESVRITTSYIPTAGSTVPIVIDFDPATESLLGMVDTSIAVDGAKHVWSASRPATARSGAYNCSQEVNAPQRGDLGLPQGTGYTQLSVTTLGAVVHAGRLADNLPFTTSGTLWPDGRTPVFIPLYGGKGSVHGTQDIDSGLVSGTLTWLKTGPATSADRSYASGFDQVVSLITDGARWTKPASGTPVLGLSMAKITFEEGGTDSAAQAPNLPQTFSITPANAAIFDPPSNPAGVKLNINAASGLVTGSFSLTDPVNIKRSGAIVGVMLSHRGISRGYFVLPTLNGAQTLSGRIAITPP